GLPPKEATDISRPAAFSADKSAAIQAYIKLRHDREVLAGSGVAFTVLFAEAMSEIQNLPHLRRQINNEGSASSI
ncbi:MAG: hypothetical protein AAGU11_23785, partial [Syntrophobacteraceae bacterium]